jgi:C4-dicarboxylate-specific signal transduction histidine kinase
MSDLTALQKQMRWKENLAALGEMSAGIAHEFKNALAPISR